MFNEIGVQSANADNKLSVLSNVLLAIDNAFEFQLEYRPTYFIPNFCARKSMTNKINVTSAVEELKISTRASSGLPDVFDNSSAKSKSRNARNARRRLHDAKKKKQFSQGEDE